MYNKNLINNKIVKTATIYCILFLIMILGVCVFVKYLTKHSYAADNDKMFLQVNIEKYINYKISEQDKGTLIQYNVKTGIESSKEQHIPLKQSQLKLEFNPIDGKYPYEVKLIPISTKATNGKTTEIKGEYRYNSENGTLLINASNLDEKGELLNTEKNDNANDEYIVITYYDTYVEETEERELDIKAIAIGVLSEDDRLINVQEEFKGKVKENIGELTSIKNITQDIYNGNIKSNIINGTKYNTQYIDRQVLTVSKKEAQDRIYISENNELVKHEKNQEDEEIETCLGNNNDLIYRSTRIKKDDIVKLLGNNGKIEILDENQNIVFTIDENTQYDENGNITINYDNEIKTVYMKTSKIQSEGILEIENTKEIKSTFRELQNIKVKTTINLFGVNEKEISNINESQNGEENQNTVIRKIAYNSKKENSTEIKDAKTNIDFNISKTEWTNREQNEISFDINLNSNDEKDNMFKNPKIEIELPQEVEKVILGDSHIVYGNGLELENVYVEKNENDRFIICAEIEGEQTTYNENSLGLKTNINIPVIIILKKDIENIQNKINFICENYFTIDGNAEVINKEYEIQIQNYKEENIEEAINQQQQNNLNTMRNLNVLSNTEEANKIDGLTMEVIPSKGDTVLQDGDTVYEGEFIKYNIKVTNTSNKQIDNVKVVGTLPEGTLYAELEADYYSIDGKYEYRLNNTISEKEIIIGSIENGKSIDVYYEIRVNNLQENEIQKNIESNIKLFKENNKIEEFSLTNIVKYAENKIFMSAHKNKDGDLWKYIIKIEGNESEENSVEIHMPKEFVFRKIANLQESGISYPWSEDKYYLTEENVLSAKVTPGNYIIYGYIDELKIQEKQTDNYETILTAYTKVLNNNVEYVSNEVRIAYKYSNISIEMYSETEGQNIKFEDEINYKIIVKNNGGTNIEDQYNIVKYINLTDFLPEELEPINITYNNWKQNLVATNEEETTYDIIGEPTEIHKTDVIYKSINNDKGDVKPNIDIILGIPFNKAITINIKATAGLVTKKTKIENYATITGDTIPQKTSNKVTHYILPYDYEEESDTPVNPSNPDEPTDPITPSNPDNQDNPQNSDKTNTEDPKYNISGTAWIDEDRDGARQTNEKLLNGITVMLINLKNSNEIISKVNTDSNGKYNFTNLDIGKYLMIFKYDTDNYEITEYKKSNISESLNSDVTKSIIKINGNEESVAITDTLLLESNIYNIDIGLIEKEKFDFKLDKYISEVSINTNQGKKVQTYNNSKLAKIEISAKEIEDAQVTVKYKIVITNEGKYEGKVGQVVDYIPEGFEFDKNINSNWTNNKENIISNTSMLNKNIKPGESIELSLILTKNMNGNSTGTFINEAEIENIIGIDIDSTPNNRNTNEDDYSTASLIISIGTGKVALFIIIIITLIVLLIFIICMIYKKGILKIKKETIIIIVFISILLFDINNEVKAEEYDSNMREIILSNGWLLQENYSSNLSEVISSNALNLQQNISNLREVTSSNGLLVPKTNTRAQMKLDVNPYGEYDTPTGGIRHWVYSETENKKIKAHCIETQFYANTDDPVYFSPSRSGAIVTQDENNSDYTINLQKIDEPIVCKLYEEDDNTFYIFGPFKSTSDCNEVCSFELLDKKRNVLENEYYTICNAEGEKIEQYKGNGEFYIKINKNYWTRRGISVVTIEQSKGKVSSKRIKRKIGQAIYDSKYQDVKTDEKVLIQEDEDSVSIDIKKSISWKMQFLDGILDIEKRDSNDNNIKLGGVKINVQRQGGGYNDNHITNEDGKIHIEGLPKGDYILTEISNMNYGYKASGTWNVRIIGPTEKKIENTKETGNLVIEKRDAEQQDKKLEGVEFTIRAGENLTDGEENPNKGKYVKVTQAKDGEGYNSRNNTVTGKVHIQNMVFVDSEDEATKFITDSEGLILIYNILKGDYNIEEVSVGNNILYDIDDNNVSWEFRSFNHDDGNLTTGEGTTASVWIHKRSSDNTTEDKSIDLSTDATEKQYDYIVFNNKRKYIKLSGRVWEDIQSSKADERNDLYKENIHPDLPEKYLDEGVEKFRYVDDKDIAIGNITVRLKDKRTNETVDQTQTLQNTGEYQFDEVLIENLGNYYIEFEYDGLTYTNVESYKNLLNKYKQSEEGSTQRGYLNKVSVSNTSKAVENINVRQEYNNRFAEVRGTSSDTGVTIGKDGKEKYKVNYQIENHEAHLKNIETIDESITTNIVANTYDTETKHEQYSLDQYEPGLEEIKDINLGLYKREMPDIALMKDLSNVKVAVNGKAHVYEYSQRFLNPGEYDGEGFNIGVKFGNKYGSMSYTRPIYRADAEYSYESEDDPRNLQVFVTYRISVKNQSNFKVIVNSIVDYYDLKYKLVKIGTGVSEGNITGSEIEKTDPEVYGNYQKTIINTNAEMENGENTDIYVQFKLDREAVLNILNNKENLNNVAEINSYTPYKDNNYYAGIDIDSNPGSAIPGDKSTYEDDTDEAPELLLEVGNERTISGKVFLDSSEVTETGERMGSGVYDQGEKGIKDVKVSLVNATDGEVVKKYDSQAEKWEDAIVYTGKDSEDGDFTISGFIPGDYKILYTWGDDTYTVQDYKGTIWTDENVKEKQDNGAKWYKNQKIDDISGEPIRFSDAKDDYDKRIQIDNETEDKMVSSTNEMNIEIEKTDLTTTSYDDKYIPEGYNIENVDFGIVERPKQALEINKRVENLKIVSAMGQTMIDAHVVYDEEKKQYRLENEVKYVTYMAPSSNNLLQSNGMLKAEIDDELIQYSKAYIKYIITVKNTSEVDYDSENYYFYGKLGTDENDNEKIIKLKPVKVYDYYDNNMENSKGNDGKWQLIDKKTYNDAETTSTLIEEAFKESKRESISKYDYYREEYYDVINSWEDNIDNIRQSKLKNKAILSNTSELIKELVPGQEVSQEVKFEKTMGIADEIDLNNDCEISRIERISEVGRKIKPSDSIIYDRGESIRITTPTGENRNYLEIVLIAITGLITIGVGIVFIKKKVL